MMTDGLVLSAIAAAHANKVLDRFNRLLLLRGRRVDGKSVDL